MNPPPLGEIAVRGGVVDGARLSELLRDQQTRYRQGDFRRLGDLLAEHLRCGFAPIHRLLAEQGIVVFVCGLCGSQYNGIRFQGSKPCLRCGRALSPAGHEAPLGVEDAVTDPGPQGDALLRANLERTLLVGRHRILGEIGRGGMGIIYKAWNVESVRYEALKFIRKPDQLEWEDEARFRREAQAIVNLQHPYIIRGHGLGEAGGLLYMAMDFVTGVPLDVLNREGVLDERQVIDVGWKSAEALGYAHGMGLIHRDIKPGNIIISLQGDPVLVDFGIAKASDESVSLTAEGEVVGSLAYMAPEYVTGGVEALDSRADIYGLGVVLYEGLTGAYPFGDPDDPEMLTRVFKKPPVPARKANPRMPKQLAKVLDKAIAKDPSDRYDSAAAMAADLKAFLDSGTEFSDSGSGGVFGKIRKLFG